MDRFIVDVVQGRAIETEGDDYAEVEVEVICREILKHPRYAVTAPETVDGRRKNWRGADRHTELALARSRNSTRLCI